MNSLNKIVKALLLAALTVTCALVAPAQNPRANTTGTITSNGSIVSIATRDYDIASVTIHGTYAGVSVVFEFSDDGTNWYPDTCTRSDSPIEEPGETIAANASLEWDCGVVATQNFRVRSTAYTSGTATINITMTQDPMEPAETVQISPNAASVLILNAAGAATTVKSTPGFVMGVSLVNNNAAVVYVEFFNTTSVTLGTTSPVLVLEIPASSTLTVPPGAIALINNSTAIAVAAVTAYNGASTGSVTGTVFYL